MTLVIIPADGCPACGSTTTSTEWHEPALVRHGGYGATRSTVLRTCPRCDWALVSEISETAP